MAALSTYNDLTNTFPNIIYLKDAQGYENFIRYIQSNTFVMFIAVLKHRQYILSSGNGQNEFKVLKSFKNYINRFVLAHNAEYPHTLFFLKYIFIAY